MFVFFIRSCLCPPGVSKPSHNSRTKHYFANPQIAIQENVTRSALHSSCSTLQTDTFFISNLPKHTNTLPVYRAPRTIFWIFICIFICSQWLATAGPSISCWTHNLSSTCEFFRLNGRFGVSKSALALKNKLFLILFYEISVLLLTWT